ncbi:protein of unknown function [Hyphomicrobium sp. MC1]|nr:protein of unknown function [Hyphomicrobium sp. MC1]
MAVSGKECPYRFDMAFILGLTAHRQNLLASQVGRRKIRRGGQLAEPDSRYAVQPFTRCFRQDFSV